MLHALLVLTFLVPLIILIPLCWLSLVVAYVLGGKDADGGLAGMFIVLTDGCSRLVDKMHNSLTTHKPVAYTFKGAVRYWRKHLAIARDVDSKNWEHLADLKRYALRNLPKDFDYGSKPNNSFHKQFRFAKYVIGKRAKAEA